MTRDFHRTASAIHELNNAGERAHRWPAIFRNRYAGFVDHRKPHRKRKRKAQEEREIR